MPTNVIDIIIEIITIQLKTVISIDYEPPALA